MSTTGRQYAATTSVPAAQSKGQIEAELKRLGVTRRAFMEDDDPPQAVVVFQRGERQYRITLPLADPNDRRFTHTLTQGRRRDAQSAREAWEQDVRSRWRALAEHIKSMRVTAEAGIMAVETMLLPHVVLSNSQTVEEWVEPQLDAAGARGQMPALLLPGIGPDELQARLIAAPSDDDE